MGNGIRQRLGRWAAVLAMGGVLAAAAPAALAAGVGNWTTATKAVVSDSSQGNPPPSIKFPGGAGAYAWNDDGKAYTTFTFDWYTQGLADFFFGANDSGKGYMFRIDSRGGANYSGFATTYAWSAWNAVASGAPLPAKTWVHMVIGVKGSSVTADATWKGGSHTFTLSGQKVQLYKWPGNTPVTPAQYQTLSTYQPNGTAYGFQGDGLGSSATWVDNFSATGAAAATVPQTGGGFGWLLGGVALLAVAAGLAWRPRRRFVRTRGV